MNPQAYKEMASTEANHWWFAGRRSIVREILLTAALPKDPRILEVGCGTGGNLELLGEFGTVSAFDLSSEACAIAQTKSPSAIIRQGTCPDNNPFSKEKFDLICLFDVLEHIENDQQALEALRSNLANGGKLLLTVPAFQFLWSSHDEYLHHHRRYSKKNLLNLLRQAGYHTIKDTYFNSALFFLSAPIRFVSRLLAIRSPGDQLPGKNLNHFLFRIFSREKNWLRQHSFPIGLSILILAESND